MTRLRATFRDAGANECPRARSTDTFSGVLKHLALPVSDQERSRRFYESYLGFDARPARRYDDDVLMLYDADGFALALGHANEPIRLPEFLHFGIDLPDPEAVHAFRDRLVAEDVEISEEWDEPDYVSVKFLDPDGYVIEAAWEPDLE